MKKIYSSLHKSIHTTPFFGRTIAVLSFFGLFIKQIFIFLSYGEVFKEATFGATMAHYLGYFVSDFIVFLILLGLVTINSIIKKTFIKIINNIILSGIFLLFMLDTFTMYFFQSRISILDMNQFINPSLGDFSGMIISIIVLLSILSVITFFIVQSKLFRKNTKIFLAISSLLFGIACLGVGIYAPGGFTSLPDDVISINFSALKQASDTLSDNTIPNVYQKFFKKTLGSNKKPNVIVVFAESFSPIDSLRVGGLHNNLPYFDLIQRQGITFTNFIANGCTSDTAHIGLLLGIEPLKFMGSQTSAYSGYKSYTNTLPQFFSTQGYTPIFISSVNLEFLNQKQFLSGIGFNNIIGEEAFTGKKQYVFDAAPDNDLYNKTLETIQQQSDPYLIVLQTISFHKPYNTPYGTTQQDALRYADKSLYYFYLQLKKSKFFDNGILVVVGDHRKMEPLETKEKNTLGEYWYSRGLATIVGTGITPGTINNTIIQHTDIFYGLKQLVGKGTITISKLANNLFSLKAKIKRNRGIVYCRYFQNNNKYTIVSGKNAGDVFNELSQISTKHKFIYQYLSSYISFENGSGELLSGNHRVTIIAHQGSWVPGQIPGNSLQAFLKAKEDGADGIEFDVSETKDKQNIVAHGPYLTETTCPTYKASSYTLETLKKKCTVKNGEPIMTLEEMLHKVTGIFDYYFIETKVYTPDDAQSQVLNNIQTVKKLDMQDKVIFTSYDKTATFVLGSNKNIHAARDTYTISELNILPYFVHEYYMMPLDLIKPTTAQEVDDMGKKLVVYTVNTTGDLTKLYHEGVRFIMTDNVPFIKSRADNYLTQ